MAMHNATPLLVLLRRLEAQNIWRMGYSVFGSQQEEPGTPLSAAAGAAAQQQQQHSFMSAAAALQQQQQQHAAFSAAALQQQQHTALANAAAQLQQYAAFSATAAQPQQQRASVPSAASAAAAARTTAAQQVQQQQAEWFDDSSISAQQAMRLLVHRIQQEGPVKQRHLQKLYERCQTAEELDKALKLTRLNYLARGELHQHKPFSHKTSQALVHQALSVGAPEVAQHALKHADMFGLPHDSHKEFHPLLIYYSKQGQLDKMFEAYQFMQTHGKRPGPETCYILVKGCVDQGRPDLGELLISEFESNGVRVREGTKLYLQQNMAAGANALRGSAAARAGFAAA